MSTDQDPQIACLDAKLEVAQIAATLFTPGNSVAIGGGSTVKLTCAEMVRLKCVPSVVTTNSLDVPPILYPSGCTITVVGGEYFVSPGCISILPLDPEAQFENSRSDDSLVSVWGVLVEGSNVVFSVPLAREVPIVRALIGAASNRIVLVSNYSRIGGASPNNVVLPAKELEKKDRKVILVTNNFTRWKDASPAPRANAAETLKAFASLGKGFSVLTEIQPNPEGRALNTRG